MAGITLTSPAFADGEAIPERHTCSGEDVAPPLAWSGVPDGTAELALLVEDPDAPGGTFVHWVLAGLDPSSGGLAEGTVPAGAVEGRNGFRRRGYGGPCPPPGRPHRYVFMLFAAAEPLGLRGRPTADDLRRAL